MRNDSNQQENQRLPNDVHNAAQDPASMKDPLKQQLEKSEGVNAPKEQETLEKLRRQSGNEGEQKG
ncbi:MAG: hypothetical protein EOO16_19520 [Chitinophagaceae bacterium]|nr:MAG: hypothetical protein EOO16_19520 [Chitinophagaceae bacterium]